MIELWERQKLQQRHWPIEDIVAAVSEHIAGIHEEAVEIKKAAGIYRQNDKDAEFNTSQILTECVDVFKHLLCLMIVLGIEPGEFVKEFYAKSDVVDVKWLSQTILEGRTVVALDLDGVLADYSTRFDAYRVNWLTARGVDNPDAEAEETAKKDFREVGGFGALEPIDGAQTGVKYLQSAGYVVGVITSRPAHQYSRIYSDTINWLLKHGFNLDFVLWERDKAEALSRLKAEHMVVVEDRRKHMIELIEAGFDVVWYTQDTCRPTEVVNFDEFKPGRAQAVKARNWDEVAMAVAEILKRRKET